MKTVRGLASTLAMHARLGRLAAGVERIPVVVYRRSREPWRVSMLLEDWLSLVREEIARENVS